MVSSSDGLAGVVAAGGTGQPTGAGAAEVEGWKRMIKSRRRGWASPW
jgi:hypothetical protein